MGAQGAVDTWL